LFSRGQRGRSKSRDPKGSRDFQQFLLLFLQETRAHQEKLYEYKEILKRKGGTDSDRASTSEKSDQAGVVEETD